MPIIARRVGENGVTLVKCAASDGLVDAIERLEPLLARWIPEME